MSDKIISCPACGIYRADILEWGEEDFICPRCKVRHGREAITKLSKEDEQKPVKASKKFMWDKGRIKLLFGDHKDEYLDSIDSGYLGWIVRTFAEGNSTFPEELVVHIEDELKVRGELDKYI